MARLHRVGHGARRLEHAHRAAHVVGRAGTPSITVPPNDHQLVRQLGAAHDSERIVDRLQGMRRAIIVYDDACLHRAGTGMVAEWQPALPVLWYR